MRTIYPKLISGIWIFVTLTGCMDSRPLRPAFIVVQDGGDIVPIDNMREVPFIVYDNEFDFGTLSIEDKKTKFLEMMLPAVLSVKYNLDQDFKQADTILRKLHKNGKVDASDSTFMTDKAKFLKATSWWDVRRRLRTHPTSIVLAQAAVESGWGSSRFFQEANNIFGVWSFDPKEERIRSLTDRSSGSIYLRAYPNITRSIEDYYLVIARSNAYRRFRRERLRSDDPLKLIHLLSNYSELRGKYIRKLEIVIEQNQLDQFDSAELSHEYTDGLKRLEY